MAQHPVKKCTNSNNWILYIYFFFLKNSAFLSSRRKFVLKTLHGSTAARHKYKPRNTRSLNQWKTRLSGTCSTTNCAKKRLWNPLYQFERTAQYVFFFFFSFSLATLLSPSSSSWSSLVYVFAHAQTRWIFKIYSNLSSSAERAVKASLSLELVHYSRAASGCVLGAIVSPMHCSRGNYESSVCVVSERRKFFVDPRLWLSSILLGKACLEGLSLGEWIIDVNRFAAFEYLRFYLIFI